MKLSRLEQAWLLITCRGDEICDCGCRLRVWSSNKYFCPECGETKRRSGL